MIKSYPWPYKNEIGVMDEQTCDVLVLGGGMAGCFAAIAAARKGKSVILLEKGAVERSGAAGTGFDHWENACTNPCSGVTPDEIAWAFVKEQDGYSNGIANYIGCREGYDRLLDIERFGGKIRDTGDDFEGAEFRDPGTKFLFAYDYRNRFTLRVWGSTFKPALLKEMRRLGVRVIDRTEATALLVGKNGSGMDGNRSDEAKAAGGGAAAAGVGEKVSGYGENEAVAGESGLAGGGAIGMNVHTGRITVFRAKATVLCMSRPARVWLFDSDQPGLCEFRPFQSIGSGHAMGWRAGMEFSLMEKSVRAEFSAAGRSFPPYGTGNNHNTWYAATMVDAAGREIPYVDRDGRELKSVSERYYPAPGQKFFLKGGVIDDPKYEYRGPETLGFDELMKRGYRLPFYADLGRMPELERKAIWGLMVGEEGKTKIPIYRNYTERGFDPEKHMLQSYGTGWQSASFLDQERQFFGAPGGIMHDWDLMTNIRGIFAGGDQLFASDCAGFACSTGYYAGRKAADYANGLRELPEAGPGFAEREMERLLAPLSVPEEEGITWKELNKAISKAMQNYCGGIKCDELLKEGADLLASYEREWVPKLSASNPHDLMRIHEVEDILTVARMVIEASLARKLGSAPLCFARSDAREEKPEEAAHVVIRLEDGRVRTRELPLDYFGDLKTEYEKRNADYLAELSGNGSPETTGNGSPESSGNGCPESSGAGLPAAGERAGEKEPGRAEAARTQSGGQERCEIPALLPGTSSSRPIRFNRELCIGCNRCASVCQCDILVPSDVKGEPPVVMYPGECYYCGACVMGCPVNGAIRLEHPLMNRARFVERRG